MSFSPLPSAASSFCMHIRLGAFDRCDFRDWPELMILFEGSRLFKTHDKRPRPEEEHVLVPRAEDLSQDRLRPPRNAMPCIDVALPQILLACIRFTPTV